MSTKEEIISDTTFKTWKFSSSFNFACKDDQATAATCKFYCPMVVNGTITNCFKELHLRCDSVFRSIFQNVAMYET